MAANLQDLQAQDDAYAKQVAVQGAQKEPSEQQPSLVNVGTQDRGHVTSSIIDSVMNEVGQWGTAAQHVGQDVMAGAATAAANTMDAIKSNGPADPKDSANLPTPVWDHAHEAITDFRDAMVVQDPTGVDPVIQAGAQLAIPFAAYSKALNALHGISNIVAAGVATDTTALAPHDMRTADLIRLGRSTDTKIGAALRAIGPYGLNAYVDYLADRTNETEAQGRFKNALDGLGANLILTPLIHAAGIVVKQGTAAAQYAVQNGIRNTISDLAAAGPVAGSPAAQKGVIAYHGTTANFDEFDASKIGTGEGNQTFGHGLYFAENPATAGHYKQMLVQRNGAVGAAISDAQKAVKDAGGRAQAYAQLSQNLANERDPAMRSRMQQMMGLIKSGNYERGGGTLVHAEIPDEHVANMVDWDASVESQPNVQKVLSNLDVKVAPEGDKYRVTVNGKPGPLYMDRRAALSDTDIIRSEGTTGKVNAGMFYDQLATALGSQKAASEFLSRRGIPGIKYLDQGSRDAGEGTRNIVLFNPKHAKIVKKE